MPVLAFYIVYCYVPMYGIVLAWKDYRPKFGITGSPWLGWENFEYLFSLPDLPRAIKNTLAISFLKLCICFPMPILFALLLNELRHPKYKKTVQTCIYLPNFISWVIIGSLIRMSLAYDDGLINNIIAALGGQRVGFLLEADYFYAILISAEVWKGTGWGTIIYIAAISGIDPTLYEAATIDGCKRGGQIFKITLPLILPVITVMFIMQLSNIMNAGFDSVYNLYNPTIYDTADIIDTYAYRLFIDQHDYALSAAVGIFKTSINFVLLVAGKLVEIQALEQVAYWHYAHSYTRGNWRNYRVAAPMILAKCCHDLDLLQWYAKSACDTVSSVGALTFFKEENTPEGAAKRCTDCRYEQTCPYSAVKYYIESWKRAGCPENIWPINILTQDFPLTEEKILQALKTGNYGRCVFACDNDVVDHQHVSMTFTNGVNATLTMMAFTQDCGRVMRFFGTYGEIVLDEQKNVIEVGIFGKERENISINKLVEGGYGHGGGDTGLVEELYRVLTGESNNPTSLAASVESHLMGIRAEESMRCGGQRLKVHKN